MLEANIRLGTTATAIEGITVTARRTPPPSGRDPAATERAVSGEALNRLPVDPADVSALATLTPGVIGLTGGDSLQLAFSVLGQGADANQMTLDGVSFGGDAGGGLGVPQEAVRSTRVITNTYDVSQGQFSGGQISTTTRGGTNNVSGSFSYLLRDPALQWTGTSDPFSGAFSQNRLSGGIGGPIIRDRLFYFGSAAVQRRSSGLRSLMSADALSLQSLGVDPDSVTRFLSLLNARGIYPAGVRAPTHQVTDSYTLLGRIDYNLTQQHTLTLRGNGNWTEQGASRIGVLGLPQTGADMNSASGGGMISLTSRFGNGWINELRSFYSAGSRESDPYIAIPGGRVRITSELEDGTRSISTLTFGGAGTATESSDRTLEVSNELSLLVGQHRLRVGGLINSTSNRSISGGNLLGSFTYNSLEDFEAGRPVSFTRSLAQRERESGGINSALYVGDSWRPRQNLQLTYGLRVEGSTVGDQPEYNPQVEQLFGRRTDAIPSDFNISPRVGFTYTMRGGENNQPLGTIRGGFGEFRSRPLWNLFSAARDATGLPESQTQLYCIGAAVPVPDWAAFQNGAEFIPSSCLGGEMGTANPASGRGANVTVFNPDFDATRSWRTSLGIQRNLSRTVRLAVDGIYAEGVSLQGVRDLNLNTVPRFTLAQEGGRPVFVPQAAIVPGSGGVGFLASRLHSEFGQVTEYNSELRSRSQQVTFGLTGALPQWRLLGQVNYTFSRSRDQGTSGGGFGRG
ncbi:MAG: TonB-dependent receptor, partial [Gemmatimonadetes bacterium]|nr:TonB-dependent receptor [Gemmatimonadota bacterium]